MINPLEILITSPTSPVSPGRMWRLSLLTYRGHAGPNEDEKSAERECLTSIPETTGCDLSLDCLDTPLPLGL